MLKDKDSKQSIQVTIRVRPLLEKQKIDDSRLCVQMDQANSLSLVNGGQNKKFTFDSISYEQSQEQIFERVGRRCTKDCLEGYNCTIFAYGQTGAGKTYTMMGVNSDNQNYEQHKGLIPRTMGYLFECIDEERDQGVTFVIRCSFLEIYNEQIIDLLNKNNNNLQLREDTRKGVYVEGITEECVNRSEQIMDLLNKGSKSRHIGSTFYNQTSSRSHSVFQMNIESKYTKNGVVNRKSRQFNFIDLAGSERTKMSTGERLKQGCNINKSLMNLASVINALSEVSEGKSQHINYRNSKLTFLLKDSLGGNSKTNLIANISPSAIFYQETLSTLSFARRAKLIKREKASINEDSSGNIDSMKNQIKRLKQEVITLMGRLQQQEANPTCKSSSNAPQMTSIMHQYVSEQIDKQTKLEMQILKLKERINYLQDGIKHYTSNQTHLRLIITVLEDKISRLRSIQTRVSFDVNQIDEDRIKAVKEYFECERQELMKQIQSFKGQSQGNKIVKELLKHAKIMKEESQEDETLKDLFTKNTNFLSMIHQRLEEIHPEKQQIEFNAEFQKKVTEIQIEFHKKEQESIERIEQMSLELSQARLRLEQSQKMLEEAINIQIQLEEKQKNTKEQKIKASQKLNQQQQKRKNTEQQLQSIKKKYQETTAELTNEISTKQKDYASLKKQAQNYKQKMQKLATSQKYLKEEFNYLEEQKYKLDNKIIENSSQLQKMKSSLSILESEVSQLKQQNESLICKTEELQQSNQQLVKQLNEEKAESQIKMEQIRKTLFKQVEKYESVIEELSQKLKTSQERLSQETSELQILAKQFLEMENKLKQEIIQKETDISTEYQKKITEIQNKLHKKEEQNIKKTQQISLQLTEMKQRFEQSQKVASQMLKQKQKQRTEAKKQFEQILKNHKEKSNELIKEISAKQENCSNLKNQIQNNLEKLEKVVINEKQLKDKLDSLEETKKSLENTILESTQQIQKMKSSICTLESEVSQLKQQNESLICRTEELQKSNQDLFNQLNEEKAESQTKVQQIKISHVKQTEEYEFKNKETKLIIEELQQKIQNSERKQSQKAKQLEILAKQFQDIENKLKQQILSKETQLVAEAQRKLTEIKNESQYKQEENAEKIEQMSLELTEAQQKYDQNTKVSSQMLKQEENKRKKVEQEFVQIMKKHQEQTIQLTNNISERQKESINLKKQIQNILKKLEKLTVNENQMNEKFLSLEETKKSLENTILESTQQIQKMKSSLCTLESEVSQLKKQNESLICRTEELEISKKQIVSQLTENKIKTEQIQKINLQSTIQHEQRDKQLKLIIEELQQKLKTSGTRLNQQTQLLQVKTKRFQDIENKLKQEINLKEMQLKKMTSQLIQQGQNKSLIEKKLSQIQEKMIDLQSDKKNIEDQLLKNIEQLKEKLTKEHFDSLTNQKKDFEKKYKQFDIETESLKNKVSKYEILHEKLSMEHQEYAQYKQKFELQSSQVEKLKNNMGDLQHSNQRLYSQVNRQKENNDNLKSILENSEAQIKQLQIELEQKDNIYKKLLEKIAKNENQSKKTANSEHYLKTIQLLEKSRAEHLELRRQNDDLKKVNSNMKEALEQKQIYIKQVEKKSQSYCVSMHKRLEEIQKDYFQLERNQQKLIKEKKSLERYSHENQNLKEEIKGLKLNTSKMLQRQEQLESRFKKCNIDYIELQKEFEQLKKGQILINTHDDKTNYINRLKAEVAALKTEKVLLTDSLNRERQEKTKLRADMRFGKDSSADVNGKVELEKKINENKNLQELIFQIVSHLKICVNEPRTKLQTIRSVILGTIKEKNSDIKALRQKVKELQEMQEAKHMAVREPALRQYRGTNYSHSKVDESKYEKEKDPGVLDNYSRLKMKQFENYYAKLKTNEKIGKYKNT